ncbi:CRISPR-associated protein Csh1 [Clostridium cavendishii DSM 21758]|uniref:CRISPR-associated protein Csh1 n=1 Tax=Clostridium cavendishii DSM 21758 TaxID=1121302 RepID=A0A1M6VDK7_9CLOT|nr:type I-B CRISPR-associated protein Cas8b/Csh1 [Clostridium cavendishii]SHK79550.1 CRISPR-associated protein Csh1 [Clostridium cavendishii DSM 21758]
MLKDCLETFKKIYKEKGEAYIIDSYVLSEGSYILVNKDGQVKEVYEVDKKNVDRVDVRYGYFAVRDYLSKLIDMNKPIDGKKVIHSNNYLTFFIKKENVNSKKLTEEIIDKYYSILLEPRNKYEKEKKLMYEKIEVVHGKVNEENLLNIKQWIKDNIFNLEGKYKEGKNYLKIFFEASEEEYKKESEKYIFPNIYNSTDYNEDIKDKVYGLPNDNMGLNSKKPYLENKSRKNKIPYLIDSDEVLIQKKFFDYLMNQVSEGKSNIYIEENKIHCKKNGEKIDSIFNGYFLRVKKGKEVEIHDFDIITNMDETLKNFKYKKLIKIDYEKVKQEPLNSNISTMKELEAVINSVFFSKFLSTNYFTEPKDIKLNDSKLKETLIINRNAYFNWFYKGNKASVKSSFDRMSLDLIKNSICLGTYVKPREQFNLRCAIINYFGGDTGMGDILKGLTSKLREKINSTNTLSIECDEEYYFAVGQLVSYYISRNKSEKKMHSLLNPILNCKSDERLKVELLKLFKKYNYDIKKESKRFNNLQAMVSGYVPQGKVKEDILIAGYLNSSLIYEKGEE